MTRYAKAARQAVAARLAGATEPCSLWLVSCIADSAARALGRRSDLYSSLHEYAELLPAGWKTRWLTVSNGSGDSMLMAVPLNWRPGQSKSRSLLLGAGFLVPAEGPID